MIENLSEIRRRIHNKADEYFLFTRGRWNQANRKMFYGATDALLDASTAAASYANAITSDIGIKLLACYGFLQALYVQQDAVTTLSRAVELNWHPNADDRLREIRDTRNRLTGHPSLAGDREKPRRLSSAIIPYNDITQQGFRGHIYYYDGIENVNVNVLSFLKENEQRLSAQMRVIEMKMDEAEQQFRNEQAKRPFLSCLGTNFEFLLERLHCDLTDENRLPQAQAHAQMIREIMETLKQELAKRGFEREAKPLQIVFSGLNLLDEIMNESPSSNFTQDKFDLIYDGLEKNINSLISNIASIDAKFRTPTLMVLQDPANPMTQ